MILLCQQDMHRSKELEIKAIPKKQTVEEEQDEKGEAVLFDSYSDSEMFISQMDRQMKSVFRKFLIE